MKIGRNQMLAFSLTLLLALPAIAASLPLAKADEEIGDDEGWPVEPELYRGAVWYKFETPLVTMIFPAGGKKPMFIWWYTNNSNEIYVVKFKGVFEYLTFDLPYYDRRYNADELTIQERIGERFIDPKINHLAPMMRRQIREEIMERLGLLIGLHPAYLPFSAGSWELQGPKLVVNGNTTYWSFNFTLKTVPMYSFRFAENNIQLRCRFYNSTATEIIDKNHNYTVAAGQLKFDFVVGNWKWNIDKISDFISWLQTHYPQYNIEILPHKTGLALWINMASIKLEDISEVESEIQNQYENTVETRSHMPGATIGDDYYPVTENKTETGEYETPIPLINRFRERVRVNFASNEQPIAGFLEFVPWARLLDESGATVRYVNVTASYIAAGAHLRLFLGYPYFGNYTLEHDPTIGLAYAPPIPTLIKPIMLMLLIAATIAIAAAVVAVKLRKKPINIVNVQ
ncbi:hypothetical protein HXY32_05530 [Candidatus Bathyarchaeota archaeon]|nr:hypothetical protein [Candidatus Bathyarchaeota archaeon]